jgi:hypothetical protein
MPGDAARRAACRILAPGVLDAFLEMAGRVIEAVARAPLDRAVVRAAGAFGEQWLRAMEAIQWSRRSASCRWPAS